jgi:hypothetical protein
MRLIEDYIFIGLLILFIIVFSIFIWAGLTGRLEDTNYGDGCQPVLVGKVIVCV